MPLLGISGVGVTDEIAKKIYNSGVRCVQVSLDGSNEEINSAFRGSGVFDKVCESIIILQKNGIKTNLAVCLNNKNYEDYKSIIKFAYDRNIYKMKIAFWNDLNGCKVFQCLNKEQKKEVINYCKQFESEKNLDEWILCLEEAKELVKLHNKALVVEADGSIRSSEHGDVIGSIYSNMPSFYYGD